MGAFQRLLDELPLQALQHLHQPELKPVVVSRTMIAGLCIWCGSEKAFTRDHYIPHWFVARMPHARINHLSLGKYPACSTCNGRKGPLPPSVYHRTREDKLVATRKTPAWRRETNEWLTIANYFRQSKFRDIPSALVDYVLDVMSEPVPFALPRVFIPSKSQRKHAEYLNKRYNDERSKATLAQVWPSVVEE